MNLIRLLLGGLAIATISVSGTAHAAPDGRELYIEHRSGCHQMEGQSGIGLPLLNASWRMSPTSTCEAPSGLAVRAVMPAFQRLSDAQVGAIVKFLRQRSEQRRLLTPKSRWSAMPPTVIRCIPNTVSCHGADGSGEGRGLVSPPSRERTFLVMPARSPTPALHLHRPDDPAGHSRRPKSSGAVVRWQAQ